MAKILWLASWFPNNNDSLAGDFIKRHAEAVSLCQPVHVIHVEKNISKRKTVSKTVEETDPLYPGLSFAIRYYSVVHLPVLERVFSYLYSLWLYHSLIKQYIKTNGKPALLHVHIAVRCGWVALYYKWVHRIPYIITEQHTVYLPEAKRYHSAGNPLSFVLTKIIFKNASIITPVSEALGNALKQKFNVQNVQVIYNVVNTSVFYPANKSTEPVNKSTENKKPVFLHISILTRQKNPEQMLEAFALLKNQFHTDFILWIVGPHRQHLRDLALMLNINDNIVWHKETSQQNLALLMQKADAFILYSRFETFGCVNIEAMACGLPVIVSDIPVFREYLREGAYFADGENPSQLALVLHSFVESSKLLPGEISKYAVEFNYKTIGKQIEAVYRQVINKQHETQGE